MTVQLYELLKNGDGPSDGYFGRRDEAQAEARTISPAWRAGCRIYLIEVPTSKGDVVSYLNSDGQPRSFKRLKAWTLTSRGGIKEVPVEGET